jgi:hypothetical protein
MPRSGICDKHKCYRRPTRPDVNDCRWRSFASIDASTYRHRFLIEGFSDGYVETVSLRRLPE